MRIEPITGKDKLGRTVVFRAAMPEDAADIIQYLKVTSGETPYLIREPDEITMTLEKEEAFIRDKLDSERELMLAAFVDGKYAGNCSLMCLSTYRRYRHRCELAIALYQAYCGCGIGKAMLETVLEAAAAVGYEQAELEVAAENESAISLYDEKTYRDKSAHNVIRDFYAHMSLTHERRFVRCFCRDSGNIVTIFLTS